MYLPITRYSLPPSTEKEKALRPRKNMAVARPAYCAKERLHGFDRHDLALIRKLVASCQYKKKLDRLMDPAHGLDILFHKDKRTVTMRNYSQYFESGQDLQGVCHELTVLLGRKLEVRLGKHYVIRGANGNCPDYFFAPDSNHCYLLAWPKWKNEQVEAALRENPKQIPPDCLIIDPSFHKVGFPETISGYTLKDVRPLSAFYNTTFTKVFDKEYEGACSTPLGYLKDLMSEVPPHLNPNSLLYIGINNEGFPKGYLSLQEKPDGPVNCDYRLLNQIEALMGPDHPVVQLMMAIRRGFWKGRE